jgi:hypothetical protein
MAVSNTPAPNLHAKDHGLVAAAEERLMAALTALDLLDCPRAAAHTMHALDLLRLEKCGDGLHPTD